MIQLFIINKELFFNTRKRGALRTPFSRACPELVEGLIKIGEFEGAQRAPSFSKKIPYKSIRTTSL